jgi:hypothetical protein
LVLFVFKITHTAGKVKVTIHSSICYKTFWNVLKIGNWNEPPAFVILLYSISSSGLWSTDILKGFPLEHKRVLESPAFAQINYPLTSILTLAVQPAIDSVPPSSSYPPAFRIFFNSTCPLGVSISSSILRKVSLNANWYFSFL